MTYFQDEHMTDDIIKQNYSVITVSSVWIITSVLLYIFAIKEKKKRIGTYGKIHFILLCILYIVQDPLAPDSLKANNNNKSFDY